MYDGFLISYSSNIYMYVFRFQNVVLRCLTPRLHCFLFFHWPSFRFIPFMAFLKPSIQFFFFVLKFYSLFQIFFSHFIWIYDVYLACHNLWKSHSQILKLLIIQYSQFSYFYPLAQYVFSGIWLWSVLSVYFLSIQR